MTYRVVVTAISDNVLKPLFFSGPFTRKSDAIASREFWLRLGHCSARIEAK